MSNDEILNKIQCAVIALEPSAQIILYGSRARGDAAEDSDYDLLILVEGVVDHHRTNIIRDVLYSIEWDNSVVITSLVRSRSVWNDPIYTASAFHQNVQRDGVML